MLVVSKFDVMGILCAMPLYEIIYVYAIGVNIPWHIQIENTENIMTAFVRPHRIGLYIPLSTTINNVNLSYLIMLSSLVTTIYTLVNGPISKIGFSGDLGLAIGYILKISSDFAMLSIE